MSVVTSAILITGLYDRGEPPKELPPGIREFGFEWVNSAAGGAKAMQFDAYAVAKNYVTPDEFIRLVEGITWEDPESVMLILQAEDDARPAVWTFDPPLEKLTCVIPATQ